MRFKNVVSTNANEFLFDIGKKQVKSEFAKQN